jgi:hypothetical protein
MNRHDERMTVTRDGSIVVFLIGMRVNRWWKVRSWWQAVMAMPRMMRELLANKQSGLLGATFGFTTQGPFIVQYWESIDKLLAYANDRSGQHFPAWALFNRRVGTNGDVGIWHESYAVPQGAYEAIYVNMPPFGLGKVGKLEPARGKRSRAAGRLALPAPESAQAAAE